MKGNADAVIDRTTPHVVMDKKLRWRVTGGLMLGLSLSALEATAVYTAMPTAVASLGGLTIYAWATSAYVLMTTVSMPLWGKLSDIYGRRRMYVAGVFFFLLGSALSGASHSMMQLIFFRFIQGLGAGGLMPLTFTIVGEIYSFEERGKMQGYLSGVYGLASLIGPLIGGLLTDHISWRAVFYINVPFGLLAGYIIERYMPDEPPKKVVLDYWGGILMSTGISTLMLGLFLLGYYDDWRHPAVIALLAAATVLITLFFLVEARQVEPLLPPALLKMRAFLATALNGFLTGMAVFGSLLFVTLFVQGVLGTDATTAGQVMTPFVFTWVIFSVLGGRLLIRTGVRPLLYTGMVALFIGFFLLSRVTPNTSVAHLMFIMPLFGLGMGLSIAPLLIAIQNLVPREILGVATSMVQFFRSLGGAVGLVLMQTIMTTDLNAGLKALAGGAAPDPRLVEIARNPDQIITQQGGPLPPDLLSMLHRTLAHPIEHVFTVAVWVAALALISALLMPEIHHGRQAESGH